MELVKSESLTEEICLNTIEEFRLAVEQKAFFDATGYGEFAFFTWGGDLAVSNVGVNPSDLLNFGWPPPFWASHIVWWNY